jgi:hypothetical protein
VLAGTGDGMADEVLDGLMEVGAPVVVGSEVQEAADTEEPTIS